MRANLQILGQFLPAEIKLFPNARIPQAARTEYLSIRGICYAAVSMDEENAIIDFSFTQQAAIPAGEHLYTETRLLTSSLLHINLYGTPFQLKVWTTMLHIPHGQTTSYGELAKQIGCQSARAVGSAAGANPVSFLIPCHRVIASHGAAGGYHWGLPLKRDLLALEGVSI